MISLKGKKCGDPIRKSVRCRSLFGIVSVEFDVAPVLSSPEPVFYFGDVEYSVDESAGSVDVHVWRAGTDLSRPSSVTLRSQKTDPPSASGEQRSANSFECAQLSRHRNTKYIKAKILHSRESVLPEWTFFSKIITVR